LYDCTLQSLLFVVYRAHCLIPKPYVAWRMHW